MKKLTEEKKYFLKFAIIFGFIGIIVCAIVSLIFSQIKLFPLLFFIVLYPCLIVTIGGGYVIYENVLDVINLSFKNSFAKQNNEGYELYDSLIKNYEKLQELINNFEAQENKTQDMLNEIYKQQENYNLMVSKINALPQKLKNKFIKFCKLNNINFIPSNYSYNLQKSEKQKNNNATTIINYINKIEKTKTKTQKQTNKKQNNKNIVKTLIEKQKEQDRSL